MNEDRAIWEVRENEARLFRKFAKREDQLLRQVTKKEGLIVNLKNQLMFHKQKEHSHLFGGTRDKVLSFRWNETPSPIEITVCELRKTKERLPQAWFAINVCIMDRLVGNEIFYKFSKDLTKIEHK